MPGVERLISRPIAAMSSPTNELQIENVVVCGPFSGSCGAQLHACFPRLRRLEQVSSTPVWYSFGELCAGLHGLDHLEALQLEYTSCDDQASVTNCTRGLCGLTELTLNQCRLSVDLIEALASHLNRLESLELNVCVSESARSGWCDARDRMASALCRWRSLRRLTLTGFFVRRDPYRSFEQAGDADEVVRLHHPMLEELSLDQTEMGEAPLYSLDCPALRTCHLVGAELGVERAVAGLCTGSPRLECLTLGVDALWSSGAWAASAVLQLLDACPLLTTLRLESRTEAEPEGLYQPEYQPPTATVVDKPPPLQGMRGVCNLQSLSVRGFRGRATDSGPWSLDKALSRCTRLASLTIELCQGLDGVGLRRLADPAASMQSLELRELRFATPAAEVDARLILALSGLQVLHLDAPLGSWETYIAFDGLRWLRSLVLTVSRWPARVVIRNLPLLRHAQVSSEQCYWTPRPERQKPGALSLLVENCPVLKCLVLSGRAPCQVQFEEGCFGGCPARPSIPPAWDTCDTDRALLGKEP
jgi:hypothetical protein